MGFSFLTTHDEPALQLSNASLEDTPPPVFHTLTAPIQVEFETISLGATSYTIRKRQVHDALLQSARTDSLSNSHEIDLNASLSDLVPNQYEGI